MSDERRRGVADTGRTRRGGGNRFRVGRIEGASGRDSARRRMMREVDALILEWQSAGAFARARTWVLHPLRAAASVALCRLYADSVEKEDKL